MADSKRRIEYLPLDDLAPATRNPKRHAIEQIGASLDEFGYADPIVRDDRTGRLVAGHGRLTALRAKRDADGPAPDGVDIGPDGQWLVPVYCGWASRSDAHAESMLVASNQLTIAGGWNDDALAALLSDLADTDPDLFRATGFSDEDLARLIDSAPEGMFDNTGAAAESGNPPLVERFLVPPFDVLDTRQGYWQDRKQTWLRVGFASEIGRDGALVYDAVSKSDPAFYDQKRSVESQLGRTLTTAEFIAEHYERPAGAIASGTSVFDPVLCELAYRWFSPAGATVIDPFAGGSVRGLIAGILGRTYLGNDLSAAQVGANRAQVEELRGRQLLDAEPTWTVGDSVEWVKTLPAASADLVFTCPPYYGLEQYSDDPADLSTLSYDGFDAKYAEILAGCAAALRPDRFAVIVVGDVRDSRGRLRDLRGATIRAAEQAGMTLTSGAVLVNQVGSVATMAARAFIGARTLGRVHQDVLVFCKGDRKRAATACGPVEVHLPDALADEPSLGDSRPAGW